MILTINTSKKERVVIDLESEGKVLKKEFKTQFNQAEKLLPAIEKLLSENNLRTKDVKEIKVNNTGNGFSSLRIGVVTANALGYALGIPVGSQKRAGDKKINKLSFSVVKPEYHKEPNITIKK